MEYILVERERGIRKSEIGDYWKKNTKMDVSEVESVLYIYTMLFVYMKYGYMYS